MVHYSIPSENTDLKKYAVMKHAWRMIGYAAYILVMFCAFVFFVTGRHEDAEPLKIWVYPVFTAAVFVSGWFIFNVTLFFSDRTVMGVITDMSFDRQYGRGLNRSGGATVDDHTYIKITLRTPTGKRKRIKVKLFDDGYDRYYKEGATIVKLRGLNYPLCPESEREGVHLCPICGVRTYYKEGKTVHGEAEPELFEGLILCRSCRHTLIDTDSLKGAEK